jgi:tetratricopeptide (TPR) repeat protein
MRILDEQGYALSGASAAAVTHYDTALDQFISWRTDPLPAASAALALAPRFGMAELLRGYAFVCSRDPRRLPDARACVTRLAACRVNRRERAHIQALRHLVKQEYESAQRVLAQLLVHYPRDVLALHVAHAFDYLLGQTELLRDRVLQQLRFWSPEMAGYPAVSAMFAFGLAENGAHTSAVSWAARALAADPKNPRAHHAMAHIHAMSGRHHEGLSWLLHHAPGWRHSDRFVTHGWWHVAVFQLQTHAHDAALGIYDEHLSSANALSDLIDASSLLWRLRLDGVDAGARWSDVGDRWSSHLTDGFCAFSDLHAMMALASTERWSDAARLLRTMCQRARHGDTNGVMTRTVGLPACRGVLAYGKGRYREAVELLSGLPAIATRLGGSQSQHSIIELTRVSASRRVHRDRRAEVTRAWPIH